MDSLIINDSLHKCFPSYPSYFPIFFSKLMSPSYYEIRAAFILLYYDFNVEFSCIVKVGGWIISVIEIDEHKIRKINLYGLLKINFQEGAYQLCAVYG